MLNFTPTGDKLIVQRVEAPKRYGSLVLPDVQREEKPQEGVVVACGEGKLSKKTGLRLPMDVKVGDRVIFGKYAGHEQKIEGVDYLVMREDELLGVVVT